jgi:hypothetical protein
MYIASNTTSPMYFEYPSRYSTEFCDPNAQVLDSYYNDTMSVLSKTNNQPVTVPFIEFPDTGNTSLLLLCIPRQTSTFSVVACIKIDLSVLGQRLKVSKFLYYGILFDNFLVILNWLSPLTTKWAPVCRKIRPLILRRPKFPLRPSAGKATLRILNFMFSKICCRLFM